MKECWEGATWVLVKAVKFPFNIIIDRTYEGDMFDVGWGDQFQYEVDESLPESVQGGSWGHAFSVYEYMQVW